MVLKRNRSPIRARSSRRYRVLPGFFFFFGFAFSTGFYGVAACHDVVFFQVECFFFGFLVSKYKYKYKYIYIIFFLPGVFRNGVGRLPTHGVPLRERMQTSQHQQSKVNAINFNSSAISY